MGDVFAGIIAGLWSSGSLTPFRSAVYLQTQCAKYLILQNGAGLTAGQLSEALVLILVNYLKNEFKRPSFPKIKARLITMISWYCHPSR